MANTLFDNMSGAAINSPFKLQRATPLDTRSVVTNYSDLALIVSGNAAYEGMIVWVTADKKAYRYINNEWAKDSSGIDKNYLYYGSVDITPSDVDDFTITIDTENDVAFIEGYSGEDADIVIPYEYTEDGVTYPITRIVSRSFQNNTNLTSVIIPIGIERIGTNAFYGCTHLANINIPESVTWIESGAFASTPITSIILPDSIKENMGNGIFENCNSLNSVKMPKDLWYVSENMFKGCSNLVYITLPENLEEIYDGAFYGCTSLESINIPRTVTSIGTDVFDSDTLIICEQGSAAANYAIENGLNYKYDIVNPDIGGIDFQLYNISDLYGGVFYELPADGYMLLYIDDSDMRDVDELLYADEVYYDISGGMFTYGNIYLCEVTAEPIVSIDESINGAITIYSSIFIDPSKIAANYGIMKDTSGNLRTNPATPNEVDTGEDMYKPVTPHTLSYALQKLSLTNVGTNVITKQHLVTALQEVFELSQNQQEYSTSPLRIGTWIDGTTPVWREVIPLQSITQTGTINVFNKSSANIGYLIPIHSQVYVQTSSSYGLGGFADDKYYSVTHEGRYIHVIAQSDEDDDTADFPFYWFAIVEYAAEEQYVVQDLNGGTSNSLDLNSADGGTESSTDSVEYDAGDADE